MVDDDDAPPQGGQKVKDLVATGTFADSELDPKTQADLARWFGLPSFQQVDEGEAELPPEDPEDPEAAARRKAIEAATAAVDPALVERLYARGRQFARELGVEKFELVPTLDPTISALDPVMLARAGAIADPREVELSPQVYEDMQEATPQAVLRDLHRPEVEFPLRLEVDGELQAVRPIDPVRRAREAMTERTPGSAAFGPTPYQEALTALDEVVRAKRAPWSEIRTPNRRVSE